MRSHDKSCTLLRCHVTNTITLGFRCLNSYHYHASMFPILLLQALCASIDTNVLVPCSQCSSKSYVGTNFGFLLDAFRISAGRARVREKAVMLSAWCFSQAGYHRAFFFGGSVDLASPLGVSLIF